MWVSGQASLRLLVGQLWWCSQAALIHQAPLHSLLMNRATISGGLSSIFCPFRWWAMDTIVAVEVKSMASTRPLRRSQMFFPFNERVFRIFPHYPAWNTARNRDLWVIKVIDFSLQFDVFCWTSSISAFDFCIADIVLLTATILDLISCTVVLISFICALKSPRIPWMQSITEPGSWSLFPAVDAVFWQLFFLWR